MSSIKLTLFERMHKGQSGFIAPPPSSRPPAISPARRPAPTPNHHPAPTSTPTSTSTTGYQPVASGSSVTSNMPVDLSSLATFANGDVMVDLANGGVPVASHEVEKRVPEEGKGKGKGRAEKGKASGQGEGKKRKKEVEGDDIKPAKKKYEGPVKQVTPLQPGVVLPPPIDKFILSQVQLEQLTADFNTPFTTALPSPGDIFPTHSALAAVVEASQRQRGHRMRCMGTYSASRGTDHLRFGCAYAKGGTTKEHKNNVPFTGCPVRVVCQPAPAATTGELQGPEGEFQVIEVTSWVHNHPPIDELEAEEFVARKQAPANVECPVLVRGEEGEQVAKVMAKRKHSKAGERKPSIKVTRKKKSDEAKGESLGTPITGLIDGTGASATVGGPTGEVGPSTGLSGEASTRRLTVPGGEEDFTEDDLSREFLADIEKIFAKEHDPNGTEGDLSTPVAASSSSSSGSSVANSSVYDFNKPDAPVNPSDPFAIFDSFDLTRPTSRPIAAQQQQQQPVWLNVDGSASTSSGTGAFDSPSPHHTNTTALTSPEGDDCFANAGGQADVELEILGGPVPPLPPLVPAVSNVLPSVWPGGMYATDPTGLLAPLAPAAVVPSPDKSPLSLSSLRDVLGELHPDLAACAPRMHASTGNKVNTVARVDLFLNRLEPDEMEALVGPMLPGVNGRAGFRAKLLARVIGEKRRDGLVWGGVGEGWVAE